MSKIVNIIRKAIGFNILDRKISNSEEVTLVNNKFVLDLYKSQVFNSSIVNSPWLKDKSFSPGGWAIDYALLYTLYRILNDVKPKSILEFGLGQSSKLIYQYIDYYKNIAKATTIEHDSNWVHFFNNSLNNPSYEINVNLLELETVNLNGYDTLTYKDLPSIIADEKFNLILVDAPFGSEHYSRSQILSILPLCLEDSFCIIIDDYCRSGEKETADEIFKILKANNINYRTEIYFGTKEHLLICSDDLKFLTSL